jgi:dihydropyrimidinase
MDYTPYEGREVTGWPRVVLSRGRVLVEDETLLVERGSGSFLERAPVSPKEKAAAPDTPLHPDANFGAKLL